MAKTDKYAKTRAVQKMGQQIGALTKPFEKGYSKKGGSVKKAKAKKKK